jgi:RNA polymerase sigma-70 factor (ECF subfamily)
VNGRFRRPGKDPDAPSGSLPVSAPATISKAAREQAFRCYVEPEIEVLLRVGQTVTGSWTDAEDLVQETLIRAWRAVDRFDGAHPRAWLLTILRHTHLNMVRRQRPVLADDDDGLEGKRPAFGAAVERSPEEQVLDTMLDAELDRAVAALDAEFRTVLLLVDVDQLSYAEAAEVLGVPVGTVTSRLSRARDRVRREIRPMMRTQGRIR